MAEEPTLEFWFEFASPYSYVAAMQIEALCGDAGVGLVWRPFLLGPIFQLQGWDTSPFNVIPRRGAYMWRDLERLCGKFGLPWQRPSEFPRNTVVPARVACAITEEPWFSDYVRRVFVANFGQDRAIERPEVVAEILNEIGQYADAVLARAESPAYRSLLRANTQRATELGIFGAPNCVVDEELFWGEETLHDAIAWATQRHTATAVST